MPRRYEVIATNQAIKTNGASDLVTIFGATGKMLQIVRYGWFPYDNTLLTAQFITCRAKHLNATVTTGSGGAAATPRPLDRGDAAATFTARANDSTQATTSGSAIVVGIGGGHTYNGWQDQPEKPVNVGPTDAFVLECVNTAIQGTPNLMYFVEVDEIG